MSAIYDGVVSYLSLTHLLHEWILCYSSYEFQQKHYRYYSFYSTFSFCMSFRIIEDYSGGNSSSVWNQSCLSVTDPICGIWETLNRASWGIFINHGVFPA